MKFTKQFEQKVLEMHDKGLSATEIDNGIVSNVVAEVVKRIY